MKNLHQSKVTSITTDDVRGLWPAPRWREEGKWGGARGAFLSPLSAMYSTLESDGKVDHNAMRAAGTQHHPEDRQAEEDHPDPEGGAGAVSGVESLSFKVYNALALFAGLRGCRGARAAVGRMCSSVAPPSATCSTSTFGASYSLSASLPPGGERGGREREVGRALNTLRKL